MDPRDSAYPKQPQVILRWLEDGVILVLSPLGYVLSPCRHAAIAFFTKHSAEQGESLREDENEEADDADERNSRGTRVSRPSGLTEKGVKRKQRVSWPEFRVSRPKFSFPEGPDTS